MLIVHNTAQSHPSRLLLSIPLRMNIQNATLAMHMTNVDFYISQKMWLNMVAKVQQPDQDGRVFPQVQTSSNRHQKTKIQ